MLLNLHFEQGEGDQNHDFSEDFSISELRNLVGGSRGWSLGEIELLFNGKALSDGGKLQQAGVRNGNQITIRYKPRVPRPAPQTTVGRVVTVTMPDGATIARPLVGNETATSLIAGLGLRNTGDGIFLLTGSNGDEIAGNKLLSELNLENMAGLKVTSSPKGGELR